ncbi:hypothetical protein HYH02_014592 [Chlamydomonas schloesseri]|uniref:Uncharacterized protein n=1 Tax=Chlamydomonas schloesseri TaxID=2026947 RepID=A0A835SWX0_9CHLO|nr:hypothetical protein HYH02_014592 [Chlamydomonas schloesseri]|eukprot:KAG2427371.1 hypothetical protein HYH02_014592 [Chlamydomonas schloesseri]
MNCYCALHGYGYHLEYMNPLPQRHLFQGRLQYFFKYLPSYQWVLMIDADVVPLNYFQSLADLLDDSYDVIVTDRDNGEVQSSYFVRSSPAGEGFVRQQLALSDTKAHANYDNGDLLQVLLERAAAVASADDSAQIAAAITERDTNYTSFIRQFRVLFDKYHDEIPHIKAYRCGWGHLRSLEATPGWLADPKATFLTTFTMADMFGHGKGLGSQVHDEELSCHVTPHLLHKKRILTRHQYLQQMRASAPHVALFVWHPYCWDGESNVCNANLTGMRPQPAKGNGRRHRLLQ